MKFLHISDVHLGCTRYQLGESPRDFFDAWTDVLKKYAVGEAVDFVIMGGDFFHKKSVPPETMNYAVTGLTMLREANIPVVTIEGNHDQKHHDSDFSWLRSLASWNLLYLIEPDVSPEGVFSYSPWNSETKRGGYIDIGRARIFGSHWYGAATNSAVPNLTRALEQNIRPVDDEGKEAFNILLLHTDVEGHQTHPMPALTIDTLKSLKAVTNYVGLGHTHIAYNIDNWAFNPGSLEVTNIDEYKETRGAWLINVDEETLGITPEHVRDYRQRPFQRVSFDVTGIDTPAEVTTSVQALIDRSVRHAEEGVPAPVVEITLRGILGFPNSTLEQSAIKEYALKASGALHVRVRNKTSPLDYAEVANAGEDITRTVLELQVVESLVNTDTRYNDRTEHMAATVIGAKSMALADENPEKIVEFINKMLYSNGMGSNVHGTVTNGSIATTPSEGNNTNDGDFHVVSTPASPATGGQHSSSPVQHDVGEKSFFD